MTLAIKDVVCFLNGTVESEHITWNHLKNLGCKADRVVFTGAPKYNQVEDGFSFSFHDDYIGVELSVSADVNNATDSLKETILKVFYSLNIDQFLGWYHSAMALSWTEHLFPAATVYYCDDLTAKEHQSQQLALCAKSDLIITNGLSAYEYLKSRYDHVFSIENTIDDQHFEEARYYRKNPVDQALIPHPRIGHFGPTDSIDVPLVQTLASQRPGWHFIFLSDRIEGLDKFANVHFLGSKSQRVLPDYIGNWDVGFLPYGPADVRRFLNPVQPTQYLVAGKPVICTPMPDVMRRFEKRNLVPIAGTSADFMMKIQNELQTRDRSSWLLSIKELMHEKLIECSAQKIKDHVKAHFRFEATARIFSVQEQA